jgi:hypothetical protein
MPSSRFICRECGVGFARVGTEWRRDDVLICPNCGGIDLVVVLDPVQRWRSTEVRRFVRGGADAGAGGRDAVADAGHDPSTGAVH